MVSKFLERKKYEQEIREVSAGADLKGDEFWKNRYDVLDNEVKSKNAWWKERYDALYNEYSNERKLSNDIIISFRAELKEMRDEYERARELEKQKYSQLLEQYHILEQESQVRELEYKNKISQLEQLITNYEKKLNGKA